MRNLTVKKLLPLIVALIGLGLAYAPVSQVVSLWGMPATFWVALGVFLIQWIAFAFAYKFQTEKFYDLTGSLTYISLTIILAACCASGSLIAWILAACVLIWALRLGTFLTIRISKSGGDSRFEDIKPNFWRFLTAWTLQGLWISLTALGAWIGISLTTQAGMSWLSWVGLAIWTAGFIFEAVADQQKYNFKQDPANRGKFIQHGLWSISRHPNYLGEITLWIGVLLIVAPALNGGAWVAVLSPIFVTLLLTKISGLPMLEKKGLERWGEDPEYQKYLAETGVLIPGIGKGKPTV
ncbi:hypothetical protein BSR28_01205 [Boudabousia liubingyangii]|nr:hypothetical protein BSR28_01205 [Boudabousia liubingyangii]